MKRLIIYIETSVWNFLITEQSLEKREITEKLFQEISEGKHEIFVSRFVIDEISNAEPDRKKKLEGRIRRFRPTLLNSSKGFELLVEKYILAGFIPERFKTDLFHIAMASARELDVIVSWNMKHIVKLKTKRYVNSINKLEGYKEIEILTPEELIEND